MSLDGKVYVASDPTRWVGQLVPNGQCVAFVHVASGVPATSSWVRGARVKADPSVLPGTAIATFDPDGTYGNHTDGRSHAAIYDAQDEHGLWVYDQWCHPTEHPVSRRLVRFGGSLPVNDGDQFYVITT